MELIIHDLQKLCDSEHITITLHAAKRLEQRGISLLDIINCIQTGEIIEQYPTDYPYPSCLVLGISLNQQTLHVVVAKNDDMLWIVTAYYPDIAKWSPDFRVRKEN